MQITVTGHHLDVGDALRTHVETTLNDKVGKYFAGAVDAQVIISKEAYFYCSEIIVRPGQQGMSIQARTKHNEVYPSFDEAADKIAKRLRRYKSRLKHNNTTSHADVAEALNGGPYDKTTQTVRKIIFAGTDNAANEDQETGDDPVVVAEMTTPIMTLTVSEAVMNLELGDYQALLFKNKATGGFNMLYRRTDGNIGWVDPEASLT